MAPRVLRARVLGDKGRSLKAVVTQCSAPISHRSCVSTGHTGQLGFKEAIWTRLLVAGATKNVKGVSSLTRGPASSPPWFSTGHRWNESKYNSAKVGEKRDWRRSNPVHVIYVCVVCARRLKVQAESFIGQSQCRVSRPLKLSV